MLTVIISLFTFSFAFLCVHSTAIGHSGSIDVTPSERMMCAIRLNKRGLGGTVITFKGNQVCQTSCQSSDLTNETFTFNSPDFTFCGLYRICIDGQCISMMDRLTSGVNSAFTINGSGLTNLVTQSGLAGLSSGSVSSLPPGLSLATYIAQYAPMMTSIGVDLANQAASAFSSNINGQSQGSTFNPAPTNSINPTFDIKIPGRPDGPSGTAGSFGALSPFGSNQAGSLLAANLLTPSVSGTSIEYQQYQQLISTLYALLAAEVAASSGSGSGSGVIGAARLPTSQGGANLNALMSQFGPLLSAFMGSSGAAGAAGTTGAAGATSGVSSGGAAFDYQQLIPIIQLLTVDAGGSGGSSDDMISLATSLLSGFA